jgi:hypothetical protein
MDLTTEQEFRLAQIKMLAKNYTKEELTEFLLSQTKLLYVSQNALKRKMVF